MLPAGTSRKACQTRCWNAVPRTSSGRSSPTRRRFHESDDSRHQLLEVAIAADQIRAGKLVLKIARQLIGIVAQQNGANAAFTLGHQDRAERTLSDREANVVVGAASAIVGGFHAQYVVGGRIKTTM